MMVNGTNCTVNTLTEQQVTRLALTRIVSGAAASVACCITLLLIVFFRAFKARLQRVFFYFIAFLTINMLVTVFSVDNRYIPQNDLSCEIVGYLEQYTIHVVLILGIGTMYVFLKPQASPDNLEGQTRARLQEIVFVGLSVTIPAIYNWIPFIHDAYGSSPTLPFCWINMERDDGSIFVAGVCYVVVLVGVPSFIVVVLSVGLIFAIAGKCRHTPPQGRVTLLLAICYLVFFFCYGLLKTFFIVYGVLRMTSTVRAFSTYGLQLTQAILYQLLIVILQGVVYVYYFRKYRQDFRTAISAWKDCCCRISSKHLQLPNIIEHTGQASFHRTSLNRDRIDSSVTRIPFMPEFSDEYSIQSTRNIHGTGETEPLIRPECSSALETGYESMSEINH